MFFIRLWAAKGRNYAVERKIGSTATANRNILPQSGETCYDEC